MHVWYINDQNYTRITLPPYDKCTEDARAPCDIQAIPMHSIGDSPIYRDLRMVCLRLCTGPFRALGNAGLSVFLRLNLDLYANNLLPWILNYANYFLLTRPKTPLKITMTARVQSKSAKSSHRQISKDAAMHIQMN